MSERLGRYRDDTYYDSRLDYLEAYRPMPEWLVDYLRVHIKSDRLFPCARTGHLFGLYVSSLPTAVEPTKSGFVEFADPKKFRSWKAHFGVRNVGVKTAEVVFRTLKDF